MILSIQQAQALVDKYFKKYNEVQERCSEFLKTGNQPPLELEKEELRLNYLLEHIKEILEAEEFVCVYDGGRAYASSSGVVQVRQ